MQELSNNTATQSEEALCNLLLQHIYQHGKQNIYDAAALQAGQNEQAYTQYRQAAKKLSKEKLCCFTDDEHTQLDITNYGRYWVLKGGYISYLGSGHEIKEHSSNGTDKQHHSKEELLEARLKLTHFRLIVFWITLVLSILGFAFSVVNFYLLSKARG
jgi:hypothetical protein